MLEIAKKYRKNKNKLIQN